MKTVTFYAVIKGHQATVTAKASAIEVIETGDDGEVLGVHIAGKRYKMHPSPQPYADPDNGFYDELLDAMVNSDGQPRRPDPDILPDGTKCPPRKP